MDLVDRIRQGTFARHPSFWPGTEDRIFMRVLSATELQEASFAAEKWFRSSDIAVSVHTLKVYQDEETIQILYRAITDSEGRPIGSNVNVFRSLLSDATQDELARCYEAFDKEFSPRASKLSEADFEKLFDSLKKKPQETIGSVSSIDTARKLLRSLVAQLPS